MDHTEILADAVAILRERGAEYGSVEDTFNRACIIYEAMTGCSMSPWQGAMFMHSMKMARIKHSASKLDNYRDDINYIAFAGQFATEHLPNQRAATIEDEMEATVKAMASKLAPIKVSVDPTNQTPPVVSFTTNGGDNK